MCYNGHVIQYYYEQQKQSSNAHLFVWQLVHAAMPTYLFDMSWCMQFIFYKLKLLGKINSS